MNYTWDIAATELGPVVLVFSAEGVVSCQLTETDPQWEVERVARELHAVPESAPGSAADLSGQFAEYFAGQRTRFDVDLDWRLTQGFTREALQVIATIEYGTTMSYAEVAALAGHPRAHRAVGTACRLSPFSLVLPVHRVIRSDGTPGEFGSHPELKRWLLQLEGAQIR